jgi:hypothetical protein
MQICVGLFVTWWYRDDTERSEVSITVVSERYNAFQGGLFTFTGVAVYVFISKNLRGCRGNDS